MSNKEIVLSDKTTAIVAAIAGSLKDGKATDATVPAVTQLVAALAGGLGTARAA